MAKQRRQVQEKVVVPQEVSAAVDEFIHMEGVQRYAGHAESVLRACAEIVMVKLYQKALDRSQPQKIS